MAHSLEVVKSNFPKEVTLQRRPEEKKKKKIKGNDGRCVICFWLGAASPTALQASTSTLWGGSPEPHSSPLHIPRVLHLQMRTILRTSRMGCPSGERPCPTLGLSKGILWSL